jgi:peptidoglycan/xylan/chitin deacetylase (PgdA/CDA1 family)
MRGRIPILTFHTLEDVSGVTSFSPQVFRRGMAGLHESGFQTLPLLQAAEDVLQGSSFQQRLCAISFDDGYETVYHEAFPVLQRHGMTATVFLTVGGQKEGGQDCRLPSLNGRTMLSWGQIREMHRWGVSFGAHTLTHPDLTRLAPERLEAEIRDSQARIEDALGTPVPCFAYPYGRYNQRIREMTRRYFACACSDRLGMIGAGSDVYALNRVDAYYLRTDRLFGLMLSALFPWYVGMRAVPRHIRRAIQSSLSGEQ